MLRKILAIILNHLDFTVKGIKTPKIKIASPPLKRNKQKSEIIFS
jgi:hypothetical protein